MTWSAPGTARPGDSVLDGFRLGERLVFSSDAMGLSIAYPADWLLADHGASATIASPGLEASGRSDGAEMILGVGVADPERTLDAEWADVLATFPDVSFGEPAAVKLGGETAYRAFFNDPSDGSAGWFYLVRRGPLKVIVIAQAFPGESWGTYEAVFGAMLGSFAFTR